MSDEARKATYIAGGVFSTEADQQFDNSSWKPSPTLEFDFTTEGPFEPQYVRAPAEGYRMVDGKLERWTT